MRERGGGPPCPERIEEEVGRRERSQTGKRKQVRTDGTGKRIRRTSPIRGGGAPEEQAQSVVYNILNAPPEGVPPNCLAPVPRIQQVWVRGSRGRGSIDRSGGGRGGCGRGDIGGETAAPPPYPPRHLFFVNV